MRVYLGGLWQETNTFCPRVTGLELFESGYRLRGDAIVETLGGTNCEIGGFLDRLTGDASVEVIPGTAAWATPYGRISSEAFDELASELLGSLQEHMPVDGVLLALHGAMVGVDVEDCEGYILKRVREMVGNGAPVVCSLDYHACVTRRMVDNADVIVGYRTYPHVDCGDTGRRAASVLLKLIKERPRLDVAFCKLPIILPTENTETDSGPMAPAIRRLRELDANSDIYAASVFSAQPWLDVDEHGASVLVYSTGGAGRGPAEEIADYIWSVREQFFLKYPDIGTYLNAINEYAKPAIVIDSGDVTSAGALGDSTVILRALIDRDAGLRAVLTMVDASAVAQAEAVGEGASGVFILGGAEDYGYNAPVRVAAEVVKITDAPVRVKGQSFEGMEIRMGKRALLTIGDNINLIVSERTSFLHDPEILRSIGINPEDCDLIVQKSHKLFRAAYKDIAKSVTILDTPGFTDMNHRRLPFKRVPRPIYPLDEM